MLVRDIQRAFDFSVGGFAVICRTGISRPGFFS